MDRTTGFILSLILMLAGCSSKPRIIVGSKNFTEQVLLGEIIAQHLERRAGIEVERKLNLGGTLLAHKALESGGIDLYPEYTGTALTAVLNQPATRDSKKVLGLVRAGYSPLGLEWLDPLGFDNTFAVVVRSEINLQSISAASARREPWRLGVGYEFVQRPDGLQGLVQTYGLRLNGDPVSMDLGLLYPALRSGRIDMAAASATDGQLTDPFFTVLADDRRYFPPYECAVVVRSQALRDFPALRETLGQLSGRITDVQMRRMNAAVDRDKRNPADVAREFLLRIDGA
jgi:glycine betaine/choline ABC-type transport system substrate-binding protein